MATLKKKDRTTDEDKSYLVTSFRCTVDTGAYIYQVILNCKDLKNLVVMKPSSAAKFAALVALLTSPHPVRYWPAGGKVGINTFDPGKPVRKARGPK